MTEFPRMTIYSDGGASPNPGPGGWGALLIPETGPRTELSGAEQDTTNNRMELTAAVEALRALPHPSEIVFYTDSEYVKKGISEWLPGWVQNNWQRKTGEVKNQDLWQALHRETLRHKIIWKWVKGHAGNANNERVDRLATVAREKMLGHATPAFTSKPAPAPLAPVDAEIGLRVIGDPARKRGGWAIRIMHGEKPETHTGRDSSATTPRLLLLATLDALHRLPDGGTARVYCPDDYLFKGMTAWVKGWKAKGWVTSSGSPVKHQELWEQLLTEAKRVQIEWVLEGNYQQLPLISGLDQAAQQVIEG